MKKFKIKSFCKINLSLNVFKNTRAGYHNIRSLITFCDVYDVITISNNNGIKDQITFSGRFKKGINKKNNTITKILYLLRKHKCLVKKTFKP